MAAGAESASANAFNSIAAAATYAVLSKPVFGMESMQFSSVNKEHLPSLDNVFGIEYLCTAFAIRFFGKSNFKQSQSRS